MRLAALKMSADMLELQRRYIDGEVTMKDMLTWYLSRLVCFCEKMATKYIIPIVANSSRLSLPTYYTVY